MVSYLEVFLPKKPITPNNITEGLNVPQRQLWKEASFVKYDKNKNVSLISAPIPIKSLLEGTKFLRSLIATRIKECDCYDAWKFGARHCANGSSKIQGIDFDQSYSTVAHADSFRINIAITYMHTVCLGKAYLCFSTLLFSWKRFKKNLKPLDGESNSASSDVFIFLHVS